MRKQILTLILLGCLLMMGGCATLMEPPAAEWSLPPEGMLKAGADTTSFPSQLTVVRWAAFYRFEVVRDGELPTWAATYPTSGSTVAKFIWQHEVIVPAYGIPPDVATITGAKTTIKTFLPESWLDYFRTRVAGIDGAGHQGPWSQWGTPADTLAVPAVVK